MTAAADPADDAGEPAADANPALEVVGHLQAAALEVIAAVRAFLDAAEEAVRDPTTVIAAVRATPGARSRPSRDDPDDDDRVHRIPVS